MAGSLNVDARGNLSAKPRHPPFPSCFCNHRSPIVDDIKSLRISKGFATASASFVVFVREEAITRDAWRPRHPRAIRGNPRCVAKYRVPLLESATGGGESPPSLHRLRGSPYIVERKRGTLGRSRLKAVIIRGIRHPLFCLPSNSLILCLFLPFVTPVLFPPFVFWLHQPSLSFSFSSSLVHFALSAALSV